MKFPSIFVPKRTLVRASTRDNLTFDAAPMMPIDQHGNMRGRAFDHAYKTHDGRTVDSTGAFLVGELERLDQTLNMPLASVTWSRDIELREDVSLGDELSSFTLSTIAAAGNLGAGNGIRNGKAWIGKSTDQIGGVSVDIGKLAFPLTLWGMEVKYTIPELESAARAGRPVDDQKVEGLKLKHQMDIDEQVYVGDASLGVTGLVNNSLVTNVSNVPNGAAASPLWSSKTPAEILAEALDPINDRLLQSSLDTGWPQVTIHSDMRITSSLRSYALLSESEQWRVDAVLAEAVSFLSKARLIVLDRGDVLDARGRAELINWLDALADNGEIDSALVFMTLKALPSGLPSTVTAHWIADGVLQALEMAEAA